MKPLKLSLLGILTMLALPCLAQSKDQPASYMSDLVRYSAPDETVYKKGLVIETPDGPSEIKKVQRFKSGIYASTANGYYMRLKQSLYGDEGGKFFLRATDTPWDTVVTAEGLGAQAIFSNAKSAMAKLFEYPGGAIQFDDPATNHLISNIAFPISAGGNKWRVMCRLDIQAKDGRYRLQVDNVRWTSEASSIDYTAHFYADVKSGQPKMNKAAESAEQHIETIISGLSASIKSNSVKSDW